jgi:hypothetical protein
MGRWAFLVFTNPVSPEREDEFNDWYDNQHLPDMLGLPGWEAACRYRLADEQRPQPEDGSHGRKYLAVYELEAEALETPLGALSAASEGGRLRRSDAIEREPRPVSVIYELY